MGKALIVIESLAAALLLVATAAAWAAHRPGRFRWVLAGLVVVVVTAPAALLTYGLNLLYQRGPVSLTSVLVAAGWALTCLVGSVVILRAARRAGTAPAASDTRPWSARSLAVAFAVAAGLTAITTSSLDVAVKGQINAVRVEAGAKALALAPPR